MFVGGPDYTGVDDAVLSSMHVFKLVYKRYYRLCRDMDGEDMCQSRRI